MASLTASPCAVDAHLRLSSDSDQSSPSAGACETVTRFAGDFWGKAQARDTLCNHLQKLLDYFSKVEGIDDPSCFGYVAQTFEMLLPLNETARADYAEPFGWEWLPDEQFRQGTCDGKWPDLDEAIGFDHEHHNAFMEALSEEHSKYKGWREF